MLSRRVLAPAPDWKFIDRHGRQIEMIARAGAAVTAHAADRIEGDRIDMHVGRIDRVGAQMHAQHLAQDDLARGADIERLVVPAFERGRAFGDARCLDLHPRQRVQAGGGELVHAGRKRHGADIHRLQHGIGDDVDGELAGVAHVLRRVFRAAGLAIFDAQRDDRGIGRQAVEEAVGRGIGDAVLAERGHEGDRPRHHGADQQFVAFARRQLAEVKHVVDEMALIRRRRH